MANTIGNRPPAAAPISPTGPTAASAPAAPATATSAATAAPTDDFQAQGSAPAGPPPPPALPNQPKQTPDEIKNGSEEQTRAFTADNIHDMSRKQFSEYKQRVSGDPGIAGGLDSLPADVRKAVLRKTIMEGILDDAKKAASKYDLP
jgi:hypothetical protein